MVPGAHGDRVRAVAQREVEIIVLRLVASYLAMPVFVVDPEGTLLYYNEPAEEILGHRFDETGEMPAEVWGAIFTPTAADGTPIPPGDLPLSITIRERRPAHGPLCITGLDGIERNIVVTALPLDDQSGRHLGSVAIFWEDKE